MSAVAADPRLAALAGLLGELSDLKRVRVAGREGSLAERLFARAWAAIAAGEDAGEVALRETARAVAATRLAGVDADVLAEGGLDDAAIATLLGRAVDEAAAGLVAPGLLAALREAVTHPGSGTFTSPRETSNALETAGIAERGSSQRANMKVPDPPGFVGLLAAQPRAGATAPGRPRVMVEPPESHADHCAIVAVGAVLLAPVTGADPAAAFVGALAHHLHNAFIPDSGFAGEVLLGEHLHPLMAHATERALGQLDERPRRWVRSTLGLNERLDSAEARAVVAADVLDRVLQMRHHARTAAFTLDQALDELDLVHAGPLQEYGLAVVDAAGLR